MNRSCISVQAAADMAGASWVRAMFEVGLKLKAQFGEHNVFDFSLGNPNAAPPERFLESVARCASESDPAAHRYMSNAGFAETRAAIARFLASEYRIPFAAEHVLVTCGAAGAMNVVMHAILDPGDEVIALNPHFVEYRFYVQHAGGRLVLVETDSDCQPDLDAIDRAINDHTRALIINSPNNPTGVVYSEDTCRRLGELLRRHDRPERPIYLICDDIYRRVIYDLPRCPAAAEHFHRAIVVSSFSKDLSIPGERIGYVALPPGLPDCETLMSAMIMLNRTLGFVNAPAFMQRVVARCADARCDVGFYRRNRDTLLTALREYGYETPSPGGAFYLFPKSPIPDDARFIQILQEHRVLAVPGRGFGRPGSFRISYAVEPDTVEKSLPGFKAALDQSRRLGS